MKYLPLCIFISIGLLVGSCGGKSKKVLVMASGKITIEGTTIRLEPGTTHNEQEMIVSGDKIAVNNGTATTEQAITEPGLYILNIKNPANLNTT